MDSTDLKIISMLKKNARVSASAIAKEVGLAVSSVTERIRRLELSYCRRFQKEKSCMFQINPKRDNSL